MLYHHSMKLYKNWALATFILSFIVILAGGIVRTTQSGMGCPDWPTCFGKWIPPTNASQLPPDFEKYLGKQDIDHQFNVYHTWVEYINRLVGVLLGLFGLIQFVIAFRHRRTERSGFRLSLLFLVVVILTGLFGAIVVKYNLAHLSITIHLFFAFLLVLVQLLVCMQLYKRRNTALVENNIKNLFLATAIAFIIHIILGTLVRIYVDDISKGLNFENRELWLAALPTIFIIHRTFSWIVLILVALSTWKSLNNPLLKQKALGLLGITVLNVVAGIILFYADMPAWAQPLHLLLACLGITQCAFIIFSLKANQINS